MAKRNNSGANKAPAIPAPCAEALQSVNPEIAKQLEQEKEAEKALEIAKQSEQAKEAQELENTKVPEDVQEMACKFFQENPKAKEVFATADGFLFTNRNFACNHASTLEVKEPLHFKNVKMIEVKETE